MIPRRHTRRVYMPRLFGSCGISCTMSFAFTFRDPRLSRRRYGYDARACEVAASELAAKQPGRLRLAQLCQAGPAQPLLVCTACPSVTDQVMKACGRLLEHSRDEVCAPTCEALACALSANLESGFASSSGCQRSVVEAGCEMNILQCRVREDVGNAESKVRVA